MCGGMIVHNSHLQHLHQKLESEHYTTEKMLYTTENGASSGKSPNETLLQKNATQTNIQPSTNENQSNPNL